MDKADSLQEDDGAGDIGAPACTGTPGRGPTPSSRRASPAVRCISCCNEGAAMAAAVAAAVAAGAASAVPPMPWFGMDIGGTLAKLVYFEPTDGLTKLKEGEESAILSNIKLYLTKNKAYGDSGHRDAHIQMDNVRNI